MVAHAGVNRTETGSIRISSQFEYQAIATAEPVFDVYEFG